MITQFFKPVLTRPQKIQVEPSFEQNIILENLKRGKNLIIIARAGTGKTTTSLLMASITSGKTLIITYNRALCDETNIKIKEWNLQNVKSMTIHSVAGYCASSHKKTVINTDSKLLQVLRCWKDGSFLRRLDEFDLIIVDESQDLRPSYADALRYMLPLKKSQLVFMGDPKQTLYDYGGDDKASSVFLEHSDKYFSQNANGNEWKRLSLTVSYRLTPNVATFVNLMWSTEIVPGNTTENFPIEYWHLPTYDSEIRNRLSQILNQNRPEDVIILNACNLVSNDGKDRPLKSHINELLKVNEEGIRKYNFHVKSSDADGMSTFKNKVRAWTFCSSKGCTVKTVIVFGFHAYKGRQPNLNQICVAISRSASRLILVHCKEWNHTCKKHVALPYVYPLCRKTLEAFVQNGLVIARDGVPEDIHIETPNPEPEPLNVTAITHITAATVERLLAFGKFVQIREPEPAAPINLEQTFRTGLLSTEENLSAILGIAVPFALQWNREKFITDVECLLHPLLLRANLVYKMSDITSRLSELQITLEFDELRILRNIFAKDNIQGHVLISEIRKSRHSLPSLKYIGIGDRQRFDNVFASQYLNDVKMCYELDEKQPCDFMFLASASQAFEGTHEVFTQVGEKNAYSFLEADIFWNLVENLHKKTPINSKFELSASFDFIEPVVGRQKNVSGVVGRVDAMCDDTVYEFKVTAALSDDHDLQTLLYTALQCTMTKKACTGILLNARTNEMRQWSIELESAYELLFAAALAKVE